MNYLLFLTIIVILLFYIYFGKIKNEPFICFKDQVLNYTYNGNYDYKKDSGIMNDYDKNIEFEKIEYKNLEDKIIGNKQESMTNEEIKDLITYNLNYDFNTESIDNYSLRKKELSIVQIDAILNIVLLSFRYNNDKKLDLKKEIPNNNSYSFKLVIKFLLEEISNASSIPIFKNKFIYFENKAIYSPNFKSINEHILSYKIDYNNNFEEFELQMIIFRDYKDINYSIYANVLFDSYNIKYYVKKIFVIGINLREKVDFNNLYSNKNSSIDSKVDSKVEFNITNFDNIDNYDKKINNFLENEKYKQKKYKEENRGHCFFKNNVSNKIQCESVDQNGTGVWDKSCIYDEDCPYFKRNRNYPNSRGGCINGYCEMPINLKRFGYKQINDDAVKNIICYNCTEENDTCIGLNCNKCCEDQKDKKKYPNLNGPDYAFEKDFKERIKYSDLFKKKNISPIKLIS